MPEMMTPAKRWAEANRMIKPIPLKLNGRNVMRVSDTGCLEILVDRDDDQYKAYSPEDAQRMWEWLRTNFCTISNR